MPAPSNTPLYATLAVVANLLILDALLLAELLGYAPITGISVPLDIAALTLALIATIVAAAHLNKLYNERNTTQSGEDAE